MKKKIPIDWHGWYFEDGYLCSPAGDRFTPECVMTCIFIRQMKEYGMMASQEKTNRFFFTC